MKILSKFTLIHHNPLRNPLSLVYLKLILTTLIWGGTFIAGRIAVQDMGVFSIAFLRFIVATLLLFGINAHQGQPIPKLTPIDFSQKVKYPNRRKVLKIPQIVAIK